VRVRIRNGPAVAHYPPGATLGPRVLPCFEYVWMLTGRAEWRYASDGGDPAGAQPLTLQPGMLLLTRPGLREHYSWDPSRSCVHAYVTFYIDEPGPLGPPDGWPTIRWHSEGDPLAALCRYLLWLGGADSGRTLDVLGWLVDLFVNGPFAGDGQATLPEHIVPLVDHLRAIWRDGVMRPPSLHDMASAAHVSPGHLARLFRGRYGIGPVSAIELIRLARAAILLERSNLTVGAISQACGFVNPFHFSRRFSLAYGLPPRAYRASRPLAPLEPVRRAGLLTLAQPLLGDEAL
jgi:AraC-like DNA-binding protein